MNDAAANEPASTRLIRKAPESGIGSILLHVQNDRDVKARLQLGLSLARVTGAHLKCLQVTPIEAYVMLEAFGIFGLDKAMQKVDAEEELLRRKIEDHLETEDVSWDYEVVAGYATPELTRRAALSDLVVTGRNPHAALIQRPDLRSLGEILNATRTTVLVPGTDQKDIDPSGTALIGWNGTIEAANAVRSAVGLLKLASEVRVIRYVEKEERAFPDTRLTEYLSRHGVHAELDVRTVTLDYADDIREYASLYRAGYLVMGAYSHSRASEFVFGGVTRALLQDCPVSLVMAH